MKIITFALTNVKESPINGFLNCIADEVRPTTAHVVGAVSGATGFALWTEIAKNLTIMMGLFVAIMAFFGGMFYATYWAIKALREWKEFKAGPRRRH